MSSLLRYFYPFLIATLVAYLTTPLVIKLANKIGIIDDPKKSNHPKVIHTYPTPRGGGLAVFLGILTASLIFLPVDRHLVAILVGCFLITVLGLLDDKYNINPYVRIIGQCAIACIPILSGIGASYLTNPLGGITNLSHPQITFFLLGEMRSIWILSDLFTVFWIVLFMNILNLGAKGVDGQLPGVVVVAALCIAFLSLKYSADITQWPIIILALITAGAYLGFLPWNFYPQKIMPSYSGSTLAGYILAILSILSTAKVGTLIVVLGIPLVDTGYVIVRRILSGKSPVWGDRGHLHHRLYDAGFTKKQIALIYWLGTALLGTLALTLNAKSKLYTIIGIILLLGGVYLWLTYRPQKIKK
jgi:UDP-GlcNAc:undecaprenyl-phosphate/decaprenyl-phosphate GlcNAc-1-phosphate transferase